MAQAEPLSPRALVSRRSVMQAKAEKASKEPSGHRLDYNEREVNRLLEVLGEKARLGEKEVLAEKASDPFERAEAAQALGRIPPASTVRRSQVSTAFCGALEQDEAFAVRVAAAHALEMFCESRDVQAVKTLVAALSDRNGLVRRAAAQALGTLAPKDRWAGAHLLKVLKTDKDLGCRTAAADSLAQVAVPGDSEVVAALLARVVRESDGSEAIACRRAVIDALSILAVPGDQLVIDTLLAHMKNDDSAPSCIRALSCLGNQGDTQVLQRIREYLTVDDPFLRRTAVEALSKFTVNVAEEELMALLDRVSDSDTSVRFSAAEALRKHAANAPPEVATTLLARLEGSGVYLLQNMGRHLDKGGVEDYDERLSTLIRTWLVESRSSLSRLVMTQALAEVARKGDPGTVEALMPGLEDADGVVRAASAQALNRLGTRGDQKVVAALLGCLKDPDAPVRRTSALALGSLALEGDKVVSGALWFLLKDEDDSVRCAATRFMHKFTAMNTPRRCLTSTTETSQQPASTTSMRNQARNQSMRASLAGPMR